MVRARCMPRLFVEESRTLSKSSTNSGCDGINYPDGQVKEEGIIFNDTKVGRWTEYFDNGKRKNTGLYIAGKEQGKWE